MNPSTCVKPPIHTRRVTMVAKIRLLLPGTRVTRAINPVPGDLLADVFPAFQDTFLRARLAACVCPCFSPVLMRSQTPDLFFVVEKTLPEVAS